MLTDQTILGLTHLKLYAKNLPNVCVRESHGLKHLDDFFLYISENQAGKSQR